MGQLVLKAVFLFTLLIVCVKAQLDFQGNGLSDKRDQKSKAVEERENSLNQFEGFITLPDRCSDFSSNCNCTGIQGQLQQLQTAVSDIADLLNKLTGSPIGPSAPPNTTNQTPITRPPVKLEEDCSGVLRSGNNRSGVYTVQPPGDGMPVQVYCDMETEGGGWTVFQRRQDGSVDFYRNFQNYSQGFGNLEGEFWLGNDILHRFTAQGAYELRIDMGDFQGESAYAVYKTFRIGDVKDSYRLEVGNYSGNAGDSLTYPHNHQIFSTFDHGSYCAEQWHGAWWFKSCYWSHLNGIYVPGGETELQGIIWSNWKGSFESLKTTEMKIRKKKN